MGKFIILLLVPLLYSCDQLFGERGNGVIVTETMTPEPFTDLELSGMFEVILEPGNKVAVAITGDENLLKWIEVDSYANTLSISTTRRLQSRHGITVSITYTGLEEIHSSGASNILAEEAIRAERLRLVISGAGKIELELEVEETDVDLSGAALIYLSGTSGDMAVSMSGAGSLEAFSLETENCELKISGVGNASVNVSGNLDAQVSGVGSIEYMGNPQHVVRNVSGVGKISESNN
jgi:hypothetical protein